LPDLLARLSSSDRKGSGRRRRSTKARVDEARERKVITMSDTPSGGQLAPRPSAQAREAAVARLSHAFAHDVLSMDEFERRTAAVYGAANGRELERLVADLPVATRGQLPARGSDLPPMPARVAAAFSNVERSGAVAVPPRLDIRAVFGNVELDLRAASFHADVTEIVVHAIFGNVEITLPPGTRVENQGSAMVGSFSTRNDPGADPNGITVRVTGRAIAANVELTGE
jgi:hypothetical protein